MSAKALAELHDAWPKVVRLGGLTYRTEHDYLSVIAKYDTVHRNRNPENLGGAKV